MLNIWIKKAKALLIFLIVLLAPLLAAAAPHDIIILHTNDIHCAVDDNLGMAGVVQIKEEKKKATPYVILVDAGDAVQGSPLGKLSNGRVIADIMNAAGYAFAVPGNHEFDYGMQQFFKLSEKMHSGYYSANFLHAQSRENVLPAYKIIQAGSKKIAFIGVTTPESLSSSTPAYFQDDEGRYAYSFCEDKTGAELYRQLQKNINKVREEGADYVFLVAHLGVNGVTPRWSSTAVAQNTRGVTAIIDGHSHEQFANKIVQNYLKRDVIIAQTGTKLTALGQITIDTAGSVKSELLTESHGRNEEMEHFISREIAAYNSLLQQQAGESLVTLSSSDPQTGERLVRRSECNLGNFVADAYRTILETDVALVNGGSIRNEIKKGKITYDDVLTTLPFDNPTVVIEATGQQLWDALEMGAHKLPAESGGFMQTSGINYTIDSRIKSSVKMDEKGNFLGVEGAYRVQDIKINGKPLEKEKLYTIGGTSYILLAGGNGMSMFKDCRILQRPPLTESEAICRYLRRLGGKAGNAYANPYGNGRITIIK